MSSLFSDYVKRRKESKKEEKIIEERLEKYTRPPKRKIKFRPLGHPLSPEYDFWGRRKKK